MTSELTAGAAFLAGLLGAGHCLGMCGGIAAALSLSAAGNTDRRWLTQFGFPVLYNLGRLSSYALAGAIVGALGHQLGTMLDLHYWALAARSITGAIIVALGLHIAFGWRGLQRLEAAGTRFWRLLAPAGRQLLPIRSAPGAVAVGVLWGWLPCSLVYTLLLAAALAGSASEGALVMASFGLGTLPAVLGASLGVAQVGGWMRRQRLRQLAGTALLLFGLWTAGAPLAHLLSDGHDHPGSGPDEYFAPGKIFIRA